MSALHPAFALAPLLLCLACLPLLARSLPAEAAPSRFVTIDGLRGFLAFFVFLHHGAIWHGYLRTGLWQLPASPLFTHFGQASVALFFMITSFLFWTRLLTSAPGRIDWLQLYSSRVLRLVPLYASACLRSC